MLRPTPRDPWGVEQPTETLEQKKTNSWIPLGKATDKSSGPNQLKYIALCRVITGSHARHTGVQLKREAKLLTSYISYHYKRNMEINIHKSNRGTWNGYISHVLALSRFVSSSKRIWWHAQNPSYFYHRIRNRTCEAVFWQIIFMLYILCLWKFMPELRIHALINYIRLWQCQINEISTKMLSFTTRSFQPWTGSSA